MLNIPSFLSVQGESHPEGALCDFQAWWLTYFGECVHVYMVRNDPGECSVFTVWSFCVYVSETRLTALPCVCTICCKCVTVVCCRLECSGLGMSHHSESLPEPGQGDQD